jgi:putative transposase
MKRDLLYRGCHFPPQIISHAVWLYVRFTLSLRDVEELLAQRGINVSYETIRRWCLKFGPQYARRLRRQRPTQGDHWYLDEVFMSIGGQRYYLWRAVDQDGDVIDILLQKRRNGLAAKRFFRKFLKGQQAVPNGIVTDKLGSYRVAHRELIPTVPHNTNQYANNLCEASHRATREKERQMKRFRTVATAQRFLVLHGLVRNLVNWGRHAMSAATYRYFRTRSFNAWATATYV